MITKTLAEIYLKQGDLRKAYEILRVIAEQDPSDRETRKKMAELSERLGLPASSLLPVDRARQERILMLKKVLANIRQRKKVEGKSGL